MLVTVLPLRAIYYFRLYVGGEQTWLPASVALDMVRTGYVVLA